KTFQTQGSQRKGSPKQGHGRPVHCHHNRSPGVVLAELRFPSKGVFG
uniref:Uncharacterized protein n=1 Tax=Anopheles minimus TaxID=112268 RepID=A0A182WMQ1_9DIPT